VDKEKMPMTIVSSPGFFPVSCGLPTTVEHLASRAHYHKGDTIYYQDGPAEFGYRIITGAALECALLADGRRQVMDFLMPGDLFGFCAVTVHRFSGEIIAEGTTVARYPRCRVERLAESDREVARHVRELAFETIERLEARMTLLARTTALEKVSAFLLAMAGRVASSPNDPIALPMSRYDIADYLALSVETVSRTLTALRQRRVIEFTGARRVNIVDRGQLQWCSENSGL
jgi:CRP/FNR family transcriptional regulator, nitrogen fixation regulation protein